MHTTQQVSTKPRPEGLDKPYVSKIIRSMSRANVAVYRATGGLLGSTWRVGSAFPKGVPVLLLTTTGRKSGEPRTAPLLYLQDGERVIIVASQGGLPKNPQWYLNLKANPEVEVQIKRNKQKMIARTATAEEKTGYWPKLVAHYSDFANYEAWTEREIPVVILEPVV